jgi:endonuclease/exonuclease/phosphatase (EEP) superfamily protein YafD
MRMRLGQAWPVFLLAGAATATGCAFAAGLGWPFELFVHFRPQYVALSLVLLVASALMRRPAAALMAFGLVIANAAPLAWRAQATAEPARCAKPAFRVVTANVQFGNVDHRRFLAWLATHPADLIVVQEVTAAWQADLGALGDYPYHVMIAREDPYGIGVLSRWPIRDPRSVDLAGDGLPSLTGWVDLPSGPLRFLALHTHWPITPALVRSRDRALAAAARLARDRSGPIVVLGDLNATRSSPVYATFVRASGLRDAAAGRTWQPTWMAGFWPIALGIDYVFVSVDLCVAREGVGPAIGSDHRPVYAGLALAPATRR